MAQPRITDRTAFLIHAVVTKVGVRAEQMIVLMTPLHVLCRGLVPVAGVRGSLCRNSRQGHQAHKRRNDHVHFNLFHLGRRQSSGMVINAG